MIQIREIDSKSEFEIGLVAQRMRQTLIDVLGKDQGTALYSMEWLLDRVQWHLTAAENEMVQLTKIC